MSTKTRKVRATIYARARGRCEHCGTPVLEAAGFWNSAHMDHFWGRAKAEENEETCWILCPACDHLKTHNRPSNTFWLELFKKHCTKHGHTGQLERIEARLQWNAAKGVA